MECLLLNHFSIFVNNFSGEIKSISEIAEEQLAFGDDFVKIDTPDRADEFAKAGAKMSDEFQASASVVNLTNLGVNGIQILPYKLREIFSGKYWIYYGSEVWTLEIDFIFNLVPSHR